MTNVSFSSLESFASSGAVRAHARERRWEVLARARRSPFYAKRLPARCASESEWQALPFTSKEDLRAGYPFEFLAVPRGALATYHESSGTAGEPSASFLTEQDWAEIADRFGRNAVQVNERDTVLVKTPYSMVTTAMQMHRMARSRGALVIAADNRSSLMPYSRVVRLLSDLGVTVTWSLPFEALLWAHAARLNGKDPLRDFAALRGLMVAGEPLTPTRKEVLRRAYGGRGVFEDYGSTETCSLAGECAAGGLHFWADRFHAEVLDPTTGTCAEEGTGELVVTSLYAEAMPLVRYNVGDWVSLRYEPCACGSPLPLIEIQGRARDRIRVQGREFLPSELEAAVYGACELELVFWQARYDEHSLEVQCEDSLGRDYSPQIRDRIQRELGVKAAARRAAPGELVPVGPLTEGLSFSKPRFVRHVSDSLEVAARYY